jgi:dipeptidyl aminopeptidase/acylaminoacyl peptidase
MHVRRPPAGIMLLVLLVLQPAARGEDEPLPFAVEDALRQRVFAARVPIDVSRDARWVAYTVEDPGRRRPRGARRYQYHTPTGAPMEAQACDVWVVDTASGESRDLTEGRGTSWGPAWSPDGRSLAFFSDREGRARLWIWQAASGRMRPVSDAVVRPLFGFEVPRWTADGTKLLTKVLPEGLGLEEAAELEDGKGPGAAVRGAATAVVLRSPAPAGIDSSTAWTNASRADLALIDAESGAAERLTRGLRPRGYWIAPDGAHIAFTTYRGDGPEGSQQPLYDLHVYSPADRTTWTVATGVCLEYGTSVSFSPDGTRLAVLTGGPKGRGDCLIVPVDGGAPVNLTGGDHPDLGHPYRAPLWDADGRMIYIVGDGALWKVAVDDRTLARLTPGEGGRIIEPVTAGHGRIWSPDDGRSTVVVIRDEATKRVGFHRVDLRSGGRTRLLEEDKFYGDSDSLPFVLRGSVDGARVFYLAEDAAHPRDLWVSASDLRGTRRVTRLNPQLEGYHFGTSRVIEWRGVDGEVLRGALLLPSDYREGRRYPLIVNVYGGAHLSGEVNRFGATPGVDSLQLLATRGYVVLLPDTPVHPGRVARDLFKAVMPGVDKVVELGIAEPERLGVMGHSFGGYSVAALITQTTRFRTAVASAGTYDPISFYGQMGRDGDALGVGMCEEGQFLLGGPPWEFALRYLENSPILHLDRVHTPVLIVHGTLDATVPAAQSDELFVGLRRLRKEAVYVRYEGEGHWQGTWGHANAVDYWERVLRWFDEHIGPGSASRGKGMGAR